MNKKNLNIKHVNVNTYISRINITYYNHNNMKVSPQMLYLCVAFPPISQHLPIMQQRHHFNSQPPIHSNGSTKELNAFLAVVAPVRFAVFFRLVVRAHIACLCVCFAVPLSFPAEQINLCPSSYAPFLTEAAQRREMMKQIQNSIACVLFQKAHGVLYSP